MVQRDARHVSDHLAAHADRIATKWGWWRAKGVVCRKAYAHLPAHLKKERRPKTPNFLINGADEEIRTLDLLITNQLLYQLSYIGIKRQV